jgi:lipoyl-dependent peroxiredoxin
MTITNAATAHWTGTLKEGAGTFSTRSGVLADLPYNFAKRFEGAAGTNPEELIGAAHAACYAMFLSALMSGAGIAGIDIAATSTVTLDPAGPTVTAAHLTVTAKGRAEAGKIRELAEEAKVKCPISKLLNAAVTLEVTVG